MKNKLYWRIARMGFWITLIAGVLISILYTVYLTSAYTALDLVTTITIVVLLIIMLVILWLIGYRWKMEIFPDSIYVTKVFGARYLYKFYDILIFDRKGYHEVMTTTGKPIIRINYLLENGDVLINAYRDYLVNHPMPTMASANTMIRKNYKVRNTGLLMLGFGCFFFLWSLLGLSFLNFFAIGTLIAGLFIAIPGLILFLSYHYWSIIITPKTLEITNFLGRKKEIPLSEINVYRAKSHNQIIIQQQTKIIKKVNVDSTTDSNLLLELNK